ncbi:MAG: DUF4258 domain-containing protein [bacterium]
MNRIVYRVHAIDRMIERRISDEAIHHVLREGETIENYPDDRPYPSRLVLGFFNERPVHIVVADNNEDRETIVITVYEPDPELWKNNFRRRKVL